jgi:type IV secretion system protein VirB10
MRRALTFALISTTALYFGESSILPAQTPAPAETTQAANAKPGDGVYLASTFPVVVGNRVLIPQGVFVQGMVDRVVRAGHVKGKAQLDMHFTSIIFPNGSVVEIPGVVSGLPGASKQDIKGEEGTIEQDKDKGRNAGKTAEIAIPTGGTVGSIAGLGSDHPLAGGLAGLAAGAATVGLVSLFTRGADVNIEAGSQVEMVLQRPLILQEENLTSQTAPGASPAMVPAENQPKPLKKPGAPDLVCPPGALGCS